MRTASADLLVAMRATTHFTIELATTAERSENGYRPFHTFTSQGTLVYPAYFSVALGENATTLRGELTLIAAASDPNERVLVRGRERAERITIAVQRAGTYAYFGTLKPTETPDFIGVVDEGYPPWLRTHVDALLPRLFAIYGDRLGRPPVGTEKPLLFASYARLDGDARSFFGDVVRPRVVDFSIGLGTTYLDATSDAPNEALSHDLDHLLAHEIAHLWNGDSYMLDGDRTASWIHEGGADALAFRALRVLGELDEKAYRGRLSSALSLCVFALAQGEPLSASTRPGHMRDFYECGSTLALLTEAAVKKRDPKIDLFAFWRQLFGGAAADRTYNEVLYMATLTRLADPETVALVRRLTKDTLGDPSAELVAGLARVGVTTTTSASLPADYEAQAGAAAMHALIPACASALEFPGNYAVAPRVIQDGACGGAVVGDVIEKMAGIDIARRGASAYDLAYSRCQNEHTVTLSRRGKPRVRVPCAIAPRARPAYLTVTNAP